MERQSFGITTLFLISLLVFGGCASSGGADNRAQASAEQDEEFEVEKVSIPEYREFLGNLRDSLSEGEPRQFNEREVDKFNRLYSKLLNIMEGHETPDTMNANQRQELFNTHEELQALVAGDRDNQVICNRRHQVGSNFKKTSCYTRQEWREAKEDSQNFMRHQFRGPTAGPSQ